MIMARGAVVSGEGSQRGRRLTHRPPAEEDAVAGARIEPQRRAHGGEEDRRLHPWGLHRALGDGLLAAEEQREPLRLAVGEAQRVVDGGAAAVGVPGPAVGVALDRAGAAFDLDEDEALGREHEDVDLIDPALVVDELEVRPRAPGLVPADACAGTRALRAPTRTRTA